MGAGFQRSFGDGIGLDHRAGCHGGEQRAETENDGEPAPAFAEAVLDIIHRAAIDAAIFVGLTILDGQRAFREGQRHAEQGNHPHPEDRAGTAQCNGRGHTGEVPRADLTGQGCGERLPGCDGAVFALCLAASPDFDHRRHEPENRARAQSNHHEQASAQEDNGKRADLARNDDSISPGSSQMNPETFSISLMISMGLPGSFDCLAAP